MTGAQGGALAALSAACCWALATTMFKGMTKTIPPLHLNLLKGSIASFCLCATLLLTGRWSETIELLPVLTLVVSGVIGIACGDSAYFAALSRLGARKTLLTESIAPPLTAFLALLFLSESLSTYSWLGVLLTVGGVAWVISESTPDKKGVSLEEQKKAGVGFALLAASCQATGAVLSRAALSTSSISPLWSALIRLLAAVIMLSLWVFVYRAIPLRKFVEPLKVKIIKRLAFAVFVGTFLAIWLQQIAFKLNNAGVAQTLLATSPLFVLPMAPFIGERVTVRAVIGAIVAVVGVALLFGSSW